MLIRSFNIFMEAKLIWFFTAHTQIHTAIPKSPKAKALKNKYSPKKKSNGRKPYENSNNNNQKVTDSKPVFTT